MCSRVTLTRSDSMRSDAVDSDRPGGFILFEVMIAIAVFSIVALSLAMAMNS
ncbi:MAG: prepilin-type N-terminal cleavage/methylation domain-containing protein, partial [Verrucomicrobiales bacterium]